MIQHIALSVSDLVSLILSEGAKNTKDTIGHRYINEIYLDNIEGAEKKFSAP